MAISAGGEHTCALLDDRTVKCWGRNASGQLGYGHTRTLGGSPETTPDNLPAVDIPPTATAISAGGAHTCALLGDGSVRCWGQGRSGQLGYANTSNIGDRSTPTPGTVGPVDLGGPAVAISAGEAHTCAVLADASVRCWGFAAGGRLGYPTLDSLGNQNNVGDDETPASAGAVDVGAGRSAIAISAGREHTCARLDDANVRCWGIATFGRLGYCNENRIGDNETPGSVGPVNLQPGDGGMACRSVSPDALTPGAATPAPGAATPLDPGPGTQPSLSAANGLAVQRRRARALRTCIANVSRQARAQRRRAHSLPASARPRALAQIIRRARHGRLGCNRRHGRTPGPVGAVDAQAIGPQAIRLTFNAAGTDSTRPPVARGYVIKQSRRPIRTARDFRAAAALCDSDCLFDVAKVAATLALVVTDLKPRQTYYYAIAARDNVSGRCGPRSKTVKATTTAVAAENPAGGGPRPAPPTPVAVLKRPTPRC